MIVLLVDSVAKDFHLDQLVRALLRRTLVQLLMTLVRTLLLLRHNRHRPYRKWNRHFLLVAYRMRHVESTQSCRPQGTYACSLHVFYHKISQQRSVTTVIRIAPISVRVQLRWACLLLRGAWWSSSHGASRSFSSWHPNNLSEWLDDVRTVQSLVSRRW